MPAAAATGLEQTNTWLLGFMYAKGIKRTHGVLYRMWMSMRTHKCSQVDVVASWQLLWARWHGMLWKRQARWHTHVIATIESTSVLQWLLDAVHARLDMYLLMGRLSAG